MIYNFGGYRIHFVSGKENIGIVRSSDDLNKMWLYPYAGTGTFQIEIQPNALLYDYIKDRNLNFYRIGNFPGQVSGNNVSGTLEIASDHITLLRLDEIQDPTLTSFTPYRFDFPFEIDIPNGLIPVPFFSNERYMYFFNRLAPETYLIEINNGTGEVRLIGGFPPYMVSSPIVFSPNNKMLIINATSNSIYTSKEIRYISFGQDFNDWHVTGYDMGPATVIDDYGFALILNTPYVGAWVGNTRLILTSDRFVYLLNIDLSTKEITVKDKKSMTDLFGFLPDYMQGFFPQPAIVQYNPNFLPVFAKSGTRRSTIYVKPSDDGERIVPISEPFKYNYSYFYGTWFDPYKLLAFSGYDSFEIYDSLHSYSKFMEGLIYLGHGDTWGNIVFLKGYQIFYPNAIIPVGTDTDKAHPASVYIFAPKYIPNIDFTAYVLWPNLSTKKDLKVGVSKIEDVSIFIGAIISKFYRMQKFLDIKIARIITQENNLDVATSLTFLKKKTIVSEVAFYDDHNYRGIYSWLKKVSPLQKAFIDIYYTSIVSKISNYFESDMIILPRPKAPILADIFKVVSQELGMDIYENITAKWNLELNGILCGTFSSNNNLNTHLLFNTVSYKNVKAIAKSTFVNKIEIGAVAYEIQYIPSTNVVNPTSSTITVNLRGKKVAIPAYHVLQFEGTDVLFEQEYTTNSFVYGVETPAWFEFSRYNPNKEIYFIHGSMWAIYNDVRDYPEFLIRTTPLKELPKYYQLYLFFLKTKFLSFNSRVKQIVKHEKNIECTIYHSERKKLYLETQYIAKDTMLVGSYSKLLGILDTKGIGTNNSIYSKTAVEFCSDIILNMRKMINLQMDLYLKEIMKSNTINAIYATSKLRSIILEAHNKIVTLVEKNVYTTVVERPIYHLFRNNQIKALTILKTINKSKNILMELQYEIKKTITINSQIINDNPKMKLLSVYSKSQIIDDININTFNSNYGILQNNVELQLILSHKLPQIIDAKYAIQKELQNEIISTTIPITMSYRKLYSDVHIFYREKNEIDSQVVLVLEVEALKFVNYSDKIITLPGMEENLDSYSMAYLYKIDEKLVQNLLDKDIVRRIVKNGNVTYQNAEGVLDIYYTYAKVVINDPRDLDEIQNDNSLHWE